MRIPLNDQERLFSIVSFSWEIFQQQVACKKYQIFKEASMQLHLSNVIDKVGNLFSIKPDDRFFINLENTVQVNKTPKEIDILCQLNDQRIALELKCYKRLTSTGGKRGATNIGMKDIYEALNLLEKYILQKHTNIGYLLVMTDDKYYADGKPLKGNVSVYSTRSGHVYKKGTLLDRPVAKKPVKIRLKNDHTFFWENIENYFFLKHQVRI